MIIMIKLIWAWFLFLEGDCSPKSVTADGEVTPRKFTVMTDTVGRDWNGAREQCARVNMTLATIDLHAFAFLFSQRTLSRKFQKYVDEQFWIGLHHENPNPNLNQGNTQEVTSSTPRGEYRWTERCAMLSPGQLFWEPGQPGDRGDALCVLLVGKASLQWRTERCGARHHSLCQREERVCTYKQTVPSCDLYVTATQRRTIATSYHNSCVAACERSSVQALPCWGFTVTQGGCVLHYQGTQPDCSVTYFRSQAFMRVCFTLSYVEGEAATVQGAMDTGQDRPLTPTCAGHSNRSQETTLPATKPTAATSTIPLSETTQETLKAKVDTTEDTAIVTEGQPADFDTSPQVSTENHLKDFDTNPPVYTERHLDDFDTTLQVSIERHPGDFDTTPQVSTERHPGDLDTTPQVSTERHPDDFDTTPQVSTERHPDDFYTTPQVSTERHPDDFDTTPQVSPDRHPEDLETAPQVSMFRRNATYSKPAFVPMTCCKCDITRRDRTHVLQAVEKTRRELALDVTTLSKRCRAKRTATSDPRASSRAMAYVGVAVLMLVLGAIVVPDLATLLQHVKHGVPFVPRRHKRRSCFNP